MSLVLNDTANKRDVSDVEYFFMYIVINIGSMISLSKSACMTLEQSKISSVSTGSFKLDPRSRQLWEEASSSS